MTRLVQIQNGTDRRLAVVEEPSLRLLSTEISLYSPRDQAAGLAVYDIAGRKILERDIELRAGENSVPVNFGSGDANSAASGILYYTVKTADGRATGKMLYLK